VRVLHTALRFWPALGGVERYVKDLTDLGHIDPSIETRVLTSDLQSHATGDRLESLTTPGVTRLHARQLFGRWRYPRLDGFWEAAKELSGWADVIHGHSIYYPTFDGAIAAARRWRKPLVLSPYFYPRTHPLWRAYLRGIRATTRGVTRMVVAVSDAERDLMIQRGIFADSVPISVVHPLIKPIVAPATRGRNGIVRACFVGRLSHSKGVLDLPLVVQECVRNGVDLQLTIIGQDDGAESELRELIAQLDLSNRIDVLGAVSDQQKEDLLLGSHIMIHPSRYEAFGIVLAEALAAGCVPIAYDTGAIPEVLEDPRCRVETGDVLALADRVASISAEQALLDEMRESGRQRATEAFGPERWLDAWRHILRYATADT
jgi:glycosyltransferase involved in cell wall biosynthesis